MLALQELVKLVVEEPRAKGMGSCKSSNDLVVELMVVEKVLYMNLSDLEVVEEEVVLKMAKLAQLLE